MLHRAGVPGSSTSLAPCHLRSTPTWPEADLAAPDLAPSARPSWSSIALATAVLAAAGLVSASVGAAGIEPASALAALIDRIPGIDLDAGLTPVQESILLRIRLPRVVLGGLVGAVLAVSGAAYQGVFRNTLADPYLLGVAAGAGLGATLGIGLSAPSPLVTLLAFFGAVAAVAVTYALGRTVGGRSTTSLILAGVAVAAFATSVQTYLLQRDVETLREVYAWILGRLVTVGWVEVGRMAPYAVVAVVVLIASGRLLDVLSIGDDEAGALGVRVGRVRVVVVLIATLATAAAVSVSGLIGFVGIIVPHTVRLAFGWSYRVIIPLSVIFGAAFLILSDLVARTLLSPAELPIGVVTAFLGAPFFLLVLRTMRGPA